MAIHHFIKFVYILFPLAIFLFSSQLPAADQPKQTKLVNAYGEHEFLAACRTGHMETIHRYLSKRHFDVNTRYRSGIDASAYITGLYIAAQQGHDKVVSELISDGADVNKGRFNGTPPLFIACQNGHFNVVLLLLSSPNIEVNRTNFSRQTPLFIAAWKGHIQIVKILHEYGADLNSEYKGYSAAGIALVNKHHQVSKYLLASWGRISIPTKVPAVSSLVKSRSLNSLLPDIDESDSYSVPFVHTQPAGRLKPK